VASAPPVDLLSHPVWGRLMSEFVNRAVQIIQPGQHLTSWYRTADDNAAVGGNRESQHLFGLAIDLAGPGQAFSAFLADRNGLTWDQEIDHLHVQLFAPGVLGRAGVRFPQAGIVTRSA